jgi:predicted DNA-binding protein (UPF0251 family)
MSRADYQHVLSYKPAIVKEARHQQRHNFDDDEVEQIVMGYTKNKLNTFQLADEHKCHRTTISNILKSNGITVTKKRMSSEMVKEAEQLYASGLSIKQIGEQMDICYTTLSRALRSAKALA